MIQDLEYSVTFPSTGKALAGKFSFQSGTTAVIGPNWSGKSFGSIEIIRYMLFGKKALRGPATDYKALEAKMTCVINAAEYEIARSSKKESVTRLADGEVLAVNTEAVNQKLIELLGFGLDIFDFVCAAPQGQVQEFSKLPPSKRKQLIDRLLRLQPQEMVEKACRDKAKTHRTTAAALSSTLRLPIEPVQPDNYLKSEILDKRISEAKALKLKREKLTLTRMEMPVGPEGLRHSVADIDALQQEVDDRRELVKQRTEGERLLISGSEAEYTEAQLETAQTYLDYQKELDRRGARPSISLDAIEAMEHQWAHISAMKKFGETEVTCPGCQLAFAPGTAPMDEPQLVMQELKLERKRNDLWAEPLTELAKPEVVLDNAEITRGYACLTEAAEVAQVKALLDALPQPGPDRSEALTSMRNLQAEWNAHDKAVLRVEAHNLAVEEAEVELAKLPPLTADIDALQQQLVTARVYETERVNYDRNLASYEETQEQMRTEQQLAEDFTEGSKAIATARLTVKAQLAPALSRVASSLIETMTAGELPSITVDENMEVLVGSQDINTLSGAGKTIANLALRIALGQVLTARVFPIFIGDEIDSDMDGANAAATAEALASLNQHLQQIILVTHKQVDHADQLIIHPVSQ